MLKIRLKGIVQNVDFRQSELTNYEAFRRTKRFQGDPKLGEAYLLISTTGNQLVWILKYEADVTVFQTERRRIESLRFRISGGYWNPLMLANYAEEVGIDLVGIKRFEEAFAEMREAKRRG